jgi:hypothetical protein
LLGLTSMLEFIMPAMSTAKLVKDRNVIASRRRRWLQ